MVMSPSEVLGIIVLSRISPARFHTFTSYWLSRRFAVIARRAHRTAGSHPLRLVECVRRFLNDACDMVGDLIDCGLEPAIPELRCRLDLRQASGLIISSRRLALQYVDLTASHVLALIKFI